VFLYKIVPLSYSCTVKVSLEQPNLSFALLWINLAFPNSIQHIHVLVYLDIILLQMCTLHKKASDWGCQLFMHVSVHFVLYYLNWLVLLHSNELISLQWKSYWFRYLKWKLVKIWLNLRNYTPTCKRGYTAVTMSVCCPFVYKQFGPYLSPLLITGWNTFIFDTQLWHDELKVFLYFHFCWISTFVWLSCSNLKRVGVYP
jgi:hypothetical protein